MVLSPKTIMYLAGPFGGIGLLTLVNTSFSEKVSRKYPIEFNTKAQ